MSKKRERERGRNREEGRHVDSSTPDDADIVPDDDDDDDDKREKTDDVDGVELCFRARDKKPRNERKCRRKKKRPIYEKCESFPKVPGDSSSGELEVQRHASVRQGISPNAEQKRSANREKLRRFCCPTFLLAIRERKLRLRFSVCAQNSWVEADLVDPEHHYDSTTGAFTGEISAEMLEDLEVPFVLLGHSERRTLLGETDEIVGKKVAHARYHGLSVVVCIGNRWKREKTGRRLM